MTVGIIMSKLIGQHEASCRNVGSVWRGVRNKSGFCLTAHLSCLLTTQPKVKERGIKVIIAGSGCAAHLPGMAAAYKRTCFRCSCSV